MCLSAARCSARTPTKIASTSELRSRSARRAAARTLRAQSPGCRRQDVPAPPSADELSRFRVLLDVLEKDLSSKEPSGCMAPVFGSAWPAASEIVRIARNGTPARVAASPIQKLSISTMSCFFHSWCADFAASSQAGSSKVSDVPFDAGRPMPFAAARAAATSRGSQDTPPFHARDLRCDSWSTRSQMMTSPHSRVGEMPPATPIESTTLDG